MITPKDVNWKLTGGCNCYIVRRSGKDRDEVYFADPNKKKTSDVILKLMKLNFAEWTELFIPDNEVFKLRVSEEGIGLEVKHKDFPNPDSWYGVNNWLFDETTEDRYKEIMHYLRYISTTLGEFEGEFTPVFSDVLLKSVSFSHPSLPDHAKIMEEMERQLNVELKKRVKKWQPGHRYDTLEMSYYFVREAYSRISNRGKGGGTEQYYFNKDESGSVLSSPTYLFLTRKPNDPSDIWSNVVISANEIGKEYNYLDFITKTVSGADCGEWTDKDNIIPPAKEWRIKVMENTLKNCCTRVEEVAGYKTVHYHDLNLFFEPLYLYLGPGEDEDDMAEIGKYVNPIIEPVWRSITRETIGRNYMEKYKSSDYKFDDEDVDKIFSLILTSYIREVFFNRGGLYMKMFDAMGFKYREIILEELKTFDWNSLITVWENYLTHSYLIPGKDYTVDLRPNYNSYGYYGSSKPKIEGISDVISNTTVRRLVLDTIKWSLDNSRMGVDSFTIQSGDRKTDSKIYEISLSLVNILDKLESEGKTLTDSEKDEIMKSRFWSVFMVVPVNIKWDEQY